MSVKEYTEEEIATGPVAAAAPLLSLPSADVLAESIAARHGLTVADLKSHRRYACLVAARRELYAELKKLRWSFPDIGRFVGGRHHRTVMEALEPRHKTPEPRERAKYLIATKG